MYEVKVDNMLLQLYQQLEDVIDGELLTGKKVVIFGGGIPGCAALEYLMQKGIAIAAVVDNAKEKHNASMDEIICQYLETELKCGIKIQYPEEALGVFDDDVRILTTSRFWEDKCKQLKEMGYVPEKHCIIMTDYDTMRVESEAYTQMHDMTSSEIKKHLLNLLIRFRDVCDKHHLTYYLCEGTLLGAVRHKGFIPWDDDIDVFMPLPDYKKLLELYDTLNEQEDYILCSPHHNRIYPYVYAKLADPSTSLQLMKYPLRVETCVWMDIFPLAGFPDKAEDIKIFKAKIDDFNQKWYRSRSYFGTDSNYLMKDMEGTVMELMSEYDYETSKNVSYIFGENKNFRYTSKALYDGTAEVEFEGETFTTFSGYKEYLRIAYGNYMELPPEWQRSGDKHSYLSCKCKDKGEL